MKGVAVSKGARAAIEAAGGTLSSKRRPLKRHRTPEGVPGSSAMAVDPKSLAGAQAGVQELIRRILFVLVALLVYRIGTHIPIPGIDPVRLRQLFEQNQGASSSSSTCSPVAPWSA